jgi:hypothetical protein
MLAIVVFLVPKIGAAADLAIKIPTPETQGLYFRSLNHTVDVLKENLRRMLQDNDPPLLANLDLDTGQPAKLGDYSLADQTYEVLLERITAKTRHTIPSDLKRHLLEYYRDSAQAEPSIVERLAHIEQMATSSP